MVLMPAPFGVLWVLFKSTEHGARAGFTHELLDLHRAADPSTYDSTRAVCEQGDTFLKPARNLSRDTWLRYSTSPVQITHEMLAWKHNSKGPLVTVSEIFPTILKVQRSFSSAHQGSFRKGDEEKIRDRKGHSQGNGKALAGSQTCDHWPTWSTNLKSVRSLQQKNLSITSKPAEY